MVLKVCPKLVDGLVLSGVLRVCTKSLVLDLIVGKVIFYDGYLVPQYLGKMVHVTYCLPYIDGMFYRSLLGSSRWN